MKKSTFVLASVLMLFSAAMFMGCNNGNTDTGTGTSDEEATSKVFVAETADGIVNCSQIATKTDLQTVLSSHTDAEFCVTIKNTSSADRTNWGIGELFAASNASDLYGSKGDNFNSMTPSALVAGGTEVFKWSVSSIITAMDTKEYLSANIYNDCVITKVEATW